MNIQAAAWYQDDVHKLVSTFKSLMSKATMWKCRQRYVPKLVYSVSVLLIKNILVWLNVLYFMDGPRYRWLKFLQVIYESFDSDLTHEFFIHDFNE